ncbi:glycosyltransferase involved in cell wall biosynthesis [Micromonospora vinacea]|uniref:Glycosyltransferase involved in cell wall biosynthesis n=1 Tax=Micromonospora vinacea TaxID=709878 RepID=A0ABS0JWL0_9ACTN|nr:glycosyltransferase involved in cell wall biosynthesis [Micromonospora vinacea]
MTQVVSVITPVHPPSIEYLPGAYESLAKQEMPDGWDWELLVQEDGQTGALVDALPDDPRISLGTGRPGGPGVARTLALSRVSGQLIKVLDADDQLTPGVLARDIAAFTAHPQIGWTTSRVLDLLPDGSTAGWDKDPAGGVIDRGAVLTFWKANDYRASVHPATLCLRRDLVFALGGWMALPASEDTGLLLAANAVMPGYFTGEYGLLYRKWPGQVTSQAAHREPAEYLARMRIIEARANALTSMIPNGFDGTATA